MAISGKSSKETQEKRRNIIRELYEQLDPKNNPTMTKKEFIKLAMEELENRKDFDSESIPSARATYDKDCDRLQLLFPNSRITRYVDVSDSAAAIGKNIPFDIFENIQVVCHSYEYSLYSSKDDKDLPDSSDSFINITKDLIKAQKERKLENSCLTHLYIILNKTGMEQYIAQEYTDYIEEVLYVATHIRCIELVFPVKCLESVLISVHELLSASLL